MSVMMSTLDRNQRVLDNFLFFFSRPVFLVHLVRTTKEKKKQKRGHIYGASNRSTRPQC